MERNWALWLSYLRCPFRVSPATMQIRYASKVEVAPIYAATRTNRDAVNLRRCGIKTDFFAEKQGRAKRLKSPLQVGAPDETCALANRRCLKNIEFGYNKSSLPLRRGNCSQRKFRRESENCEAASVQWRATALIRVAHNCALKTRQFRLWAKSEQIARS